MIKTRKINEIFAKTFLILKSTSRISCAKIRYNLLLFTGLLRYIAGKRGIAAILV